MLKKKIGRKFIFLFLILIFMLVVAILFIRIQVNKQENGKTLPLRDLAKKNNMLLGASVSSVPFYKDNLYRKMIKKEFNIITIENDLKFSSVHPSENQFNFNRSDKIIQFAKKNDIKVRGHTLVWDKHLPNWVTKNNYSNEELKLILRDHIKKVVGHYRGKIYAWDVVNEAFNEDGSLKNNFWLRHIGPEYIEFAYKWAHEADPNALLFYNDYNYAGINIKSTKIYNEVKRLKEKGVPIDGIGFQFHKTTEDKINFRSISENIKRFSESGFRVEFTEVDVKIQNINNNTLNNKIALRKQAKIYSNTLNVCLSNESCNAFVMWGVVDKYSWLPEDNKPLILNKNYQPKPAYFSIYKTLEKN